MSVMGSGRTKIVLMQAGLAFVSALGAGLLAGELLQFDHGLGCMECLLVRIVAIMSAAVLVLILPVIILLVKNRALRLIHGLNVAFAVISIISLFSSLVSFGLFSRSASQHVNFLHELDLDSVVLVAVLYFSAGAVLSVTTAVLMGRDVMKQKLDEIVEATKKLPGGGLR
jgi:hypothetical protein